VKSSWKKGARAFRASFDDFRRGGAISPGACPVPASAKYNSATSMKEHVMQELMKGRRGLIMGIANDHSIAWGMAKTLHAHGAELAFTYQGEALGRRVRPLAEQLGVELVLPCDVEDIATVDATFAALQEKWGQLDFVIHAIGFSDRNELKGRYADTSRENFSRTMVISCFSFTEIARRAAEMALTRMPRDPKSKAR